MLTIARARASYLDAALVMPDAYAFGSEGTGYTGAFGSGTPASKYTFANWVAAAAAAIEIS